VWALRGPRLYPSLSQRTPRASAQPTVEPNVDGRRGLGSGGVWALGPPSLLLPAGARPRPPARGGPDRSVEARITPPARASGTRHLAPLPRSVSSPSQGRTVGWRVARRSGPLLLAHRPLPFPVQTPLVPASGQLWTAGARALAGLSTSGGDRPGVPSTAVTASNTERSRHPARTGLNAPAWNDKGSTDGADQSPACSQLHTGTRRSPHRFPPVHPAPPPQSSGGRRHNGALDRDKGLRTPTPRAPITEPGIISGADNAHTPTARGREAGIRRDGRGQRPPLCRPLPPGVTGSTSITKGLHRGGAYHGRQR